MSAKHIGQLNLDKVWDVEWKYTASYSWPCYDHSDYHTYYAQTLTFDDGILIACDPKEGAYGSMPDPAGP